MVTPDIGSMGRRSTAMTCPRGGVGQGGITLGVVSSTCFACMIRIAASLHPPGAAPKSTTTRGLPAKSLNFSSSSINLNALRERKTSPSRCLTNGSRDCRLSHAFDELEVDLKRRCMRMTCTGIVVARGSILDDRMSQLLTAKSLVTRLPFLRHV